ncbi:MAG: aminoacyl-tRNA hydrolase [Planctomycetes bacterium]|nr:aminoacyl-tRNA hydrolase [Planctomycetota bacterium]
MAGISIRPGLEIPEDELRFEADRSSGPGGQHVNTSSTRIALSFDVAQSPSLTEYDRQRILTRLAKRINKEGVLRIVAQSERSQSRNRELAVERFQELMAKALVRPKARRPTKPTAGSRRRRLADKKQRGEIKRDRRRPPSHD